MANRRMRVYISGPISSGGYDALYGNLKNGIVLWRELVRLGFAPYCPHMNDLGYIVTEPVTWEDALEVDEEWVDASEVMLRMPGESRGAEREEQFCYDKGIPVVFSVEELLKFRASCNESIRTISDGSPLYKVSNG